MEHEADYDRARILSPPGKDEADETGVSSLESLSSLGLRKVWTSRCPVPSPLPHGPMISASCHNVSSQI